MSLYIYVYYIMVVYMHVAELQLNFAIEHVNYNRAALGIRIYMIQ